MAKQRNKEEMKSIREGGPGRPELYSTTEELQSAIDDYFEQCEKGKEVSVFDRKSQTMITITRERPRTVEGLAVHLGMSRQSLLNYSVDSRFFDAITRAKEKILAWKQEAAWMGDVDPRVWQFDLKNNHEYRDEVENTVRMNTTCILPDPIQDESEPD